MEQKGVGVGTALVVVAVSWWWWWRHGSAMVVQWWYHGGWWCHGGYGGKRLSWENIKTKDSFFSSHSFLAESK